MEAKPNFTERKYFVILLFVTSLFLLWGIAMSLGDTLNKHFQNVLHISKARSAYVQLSLFGAYAVMGIPAGLFMRRFGYKWGVLLGLCLVFCRWRFFVCARIKCGVVWFLPVCAVCARLRPGNARNGCPPICCRFR